MLLKQRGLEKPPATAVHTMFSSVHSPLKDYKGRNLGPASEGIPVRWRVAARMTADSVSGMLYIVRQPRRKTMPADDTDTYVECIVAAILTTITVDETAHGIPYIVKRYAETLQQLREQGGAINPSRA